MKALINNSWQKTYPVLAVFFIFSATFNLIRLVWTHFPIIFIALSVPIIAVVIILLFYFIKNELRAYKRGYKITTWGEPKDETVTYREGKLRLRFPRQAHGNTFILTVLDEASWKQEMPDGAKDRREIIIQRLLEEFADVEPRMTVELDVVDLSNYAPDTHHRLRAFMWPKKYKKRNLRDVGEA